MNRYVWSRSAVLAVLSLAASVAPSLSHAEGGDDSIQLKIASALRSDRLFMRAGVILAHIKTKSGDTYDVTGPVMTSSEISNVYAAGRSYTAYPNLQLVSTNAATGATLIDPQTNAPYTQQRMYDLLVGGTVGIRQASAGLSTLLNELDSKGLQGIGTPAGITGEAKASASTAGISLGYFLDDDYKWLVETYVLAAPLSSSVTIHGTASGVDSSLADYTKPIGIDGQKGITTKIVPPIAVLGRYWGAKEAKFRPYTGLMAMYAIFVDTKATQVMNLYVGGSNPGDTTVSIKNSFGMGPVVGFKYTLGENWHASMNVGSVKLKALATITTRNTLITGDSAVTKDLGTVTDVINTGDTVFSNPIGGQCAANSNGTPASQNRQVVCSTIYRNGGLTNLITKGVLADKGQTNFGTFVRKTDTTLDNTILFLSVGRSF